MPIRICKIADLAPKARGRHSIVQRLSEYIDLKTKLANGLKPYEAIEVKLEPSSEKGHRSILQTFKRQVQDDLKRLGLTDITVSAYKSEGKNVIAVYNEPVITTASSSKKAKKELATA